MSCDKQQPPPYFFLHNFIIFTTFPLHIYARYDNMRNVEICLCSHLLLHPPTRYLRKVLHWIKKINYWYLHLTMREVKIDYIIKKKRWRFIYKTNSFDLSGKFDMWIWRQNRLPLVVEKLIFIAFELCFSLEADRPRTTVPSLHFGFFQRPQMLSSFVT